MKPGPKPRKEPGKTSLRPFGGPSRSPLKEVKRREERALKDFGRKVRGEK